MPENFMILIFIGNRAPQEENIEMSVVKIYQ